MDVSKFKVPEHWPVDAKAFAREAISEILGLKEALKKMMADFVALQATFEKAQAEIRELKSKLGTNSTNSSLPPSKDPPSTPSRETKPSGRKQGAQKGHPGSGRALFPPERVDSTLNIFPEQCPNSGIRIRPEDLTDLSFKRVQQVDLPNAIRVLVTEYRLYTGLCPCGCGKRLSATMPAEAGNTAVGPRLKALMALLAGRYRLSKDLIREFLVDVFGPDADFSTGCISEAESEMAEALKKPYDEASMTTVLHSAATDSSGPCTDFPEP